MASMKIRKGDQAVRPSVSLTEFSLRENIAGSKGVA